MSGRVAIIYNEPVVGRYHTLGEGGAVEGVLDSVTPLSRSLNELSYEVLTVALRLPLSRVEAELNKLNVDVVFNLFEGFDRIPGSEAAVAAILESLGFCFTGCPSKSLRLCENKAITKQLLRARCIPTPNWQVLTPKAWGIFNIKFPCIVKPLGEHASHGLFEKSVVEDVKTLREQVRLLWEAYERPSLVEEFLPGREFRALVVGNRHPRVLPIEEIVYELPPDRPRLLTYAAKWIPGHEYFVGTQEKCPAEIQPDLKETIEIMALKSFAALKCRG
jgi:D-alanine-D-alanine ligase